MLRSPTPGKGLREKAKGRGQWGEGAKLQPKPFSHRVFNAVSNLTTSHLVRLSFLHLVPEFFVFLIARPINFDGVSTLLGCPQSLPWVGSVVDYAERVAPSALARPRSKCYVPLAQITSQDP